MQSVRDYDAALGMFREPAKPVDLGYLCFIRWLVEEGRLEHLPAGPPSGEWADRLALRRLLAEAV
ncbi:MAG TPA: hypothetical protein VFE37_28530 [Chloroflexota bacterium]|nr:hypothetical protein [Chloroflexota bacterium]